MKTPFAYFSKMTLRVPQCDDPTQTRNDPTGRLGKYDLSKRGYYSAAILLLCGALGGCPKSCGGDDKPGGAFDDFAAHATITSVTPNQAVPLTSVNVRIVGSHLNQAKRIEFESAGVDVSNMVVVSDSEITATFTIEFFSSGGSFSVVGADDANSNTLKFTALGSPPASAVFRVQPSNTAVGNIIAPPVQVEIRDIDGNTVTTATNLVTLSINFAVHASNPTFSGARTVAAIAGVATFNDLSLDKADTYILAASVDKTSFAPVQSDSFNVTASATVDSKVAFVTLPSNTVAGAIIAPVRVAIQDSNGVTDPSAVNQVTLAIASNPNGGTLSGTLTMPAVQGVATFSNLSIDKAGNGYSLTASSPALTAATSTAFNVTALVVPTAPGTVLAPGNRPALDDAGGTAVVGNNTGPIVAIKDGTGHWAQATQLTNPDGLVASVAISGDGSTAVVSSCQIATCIGHAFVYAKPAGGWSASPSLSPTAILSTSDGIAGDRIGFSIATDQTGTTVAVGSPCGVTGGSPQCGSVYVFVRPSSGGWVNANQSAKLTVASVNYVGYSVALDAAGNTIAAGATSILNADPGAVFVFQKPAGGWSDTSSAATKLIASENGGAQLGASVSISSDGGTVVAGAPISVFPDTTTGSTGPGAAFVFAKPSGGWASATSKTEDAKLTASNRQPGDGFGASVSLAGEGRVVVVGATLSPYTFATHVAGPGAVFKFVMPSAGWAGALTENQKLLAFSGVDINGVAVSPAGGFGGSVAISKDSSTIAVGGSSTPSAPSARQVVFVF